MGLLGDVIQLFFLIDNDFIKMKLRNIMQIWWNIY